VKNHGSATELWRMDLRGNRLPLWTEEDGTEIPCKVPAGGPTYLDKLGIAPRYCLDSDVALSEGGDGSVVLCASDRIVRYHRNGTPLYNAKMPFRLYYTSLPYMDVEGYVYVLCESNSSCFVARVDPKGTQMETWLANYRCGGPVVDGTFVRREDGVYCFFDSGTRLTMVRDDQTVISRTPKAQKDLQEKRKKWEKDQD
ncbi:hypothetical protein KKF84_02505, partial [Myxococcota bacterium]|nr:hypothetical protein [Myxococcota bacterium]MBU1534160.1 hypothetical protein [Myxococcota bacterium]